MKDSVPTLPKPERKHPEPSQIRADQIVNPVLRGMHPDPTVCRVGNTFYLATSSFGLFPGIPLYASDNLADWHFVRHILSRPSQIPFHSKQSIVGAGLFAPTLRHDGERFYLVCTNHQNGENFLVSAVDPAGEWSEPVWIEDTYQGGIDPSLTILGPGRALYQMTGDPGRGDPTGIVQFEIDLATGKGKSPRRHISNGCGWKAVEGPHLFQRGDYWYLLTAEGGTEANHRVAIARSNDPFGPWTACPRNPILTHAGIQSTVQNTGHADLFDDPTGNWWIAFLGIRPLAYPPVHITGRETFIAPVAWGPDGWPIVNGGAPVELSDDLKTSTAIWSDSFENSEKLHPRWVTLGPSYDRVYQLDSGGLQLLGVSETLSESSQRGFVGTRLDETRRRFETVVRPGEKAQAGLSVFMESTAYYSLGIVRSEPGRNKVRLTRHALDLETVFERDCPDSSSYRLRVDLVEGDSPWNHQHHEFVFSLQVESAGWEEIGRGSCRLLSTELVGGFGGLLVGMYCLSKDKTGTAHFESFTADLPED